MRTSRNSTRRSRTTSKPTATGRSSPSCSKKKTEARQQQQTATKERDTRQRGVREPLTGIRAEATRLETKLATELTPDEEAELRARQEYVADRRAMLEASLPFAGIPTDTLEARIEEAEYQREELRDALDKIHSPGSKPSAHARRLQAELKTLDEGRRALSVELQTRELQGANKELAHRAAVRDSERELRAEDAKAISEADEARRGTKTEDLAETSPLGSRCESPLWSNVFGKRQRRMS